METAKVTETTETTEPVKEPVIQFGEMVDILFKKTGMHEQHTGLMHAAIGISGEVAEIIEALKKDDTKNLIEEFGDLEFYITAARTSAGINDDMLRRATDFVILQDHDYSDMCSNFVIAAGNVLDQAKRCWVYGSDINEKRQDITNKLALLMYYLDYFYNANHYHIEEILRANIDKLVGPKGRYRDKVYSDIAARERADKQGAINV